MEEQEQGGKEDGERESGIQNQNHSLSLTSFQFVLSNW